MPDSSDTPEEGRREEGVIASVRRILGADAARQRGAQGEAVSLFPPFEPRPRPTGTTPVAAAGAAPDRPSDATAAHVPPAPASVDEDVLELETGMMIDDQGDPARQAAASGALSPATGGPYAAEPVPARGETAGGALGSLRSVLREQRAQGTAVSRGGTTIEELIREELRPMLKEWLDAHLPPLVERIARAEIARIIERDGA